MPADVSADNTLSRGIARFSRKTVWCKYLSGLKRMGVSKEPSYLFASEITSGVAAVVGCLAEVSPGLTTSGALFSSPRISSVCRLHGISKGCETSVWHQRVERISALGRGSTGRFLGT